MTNLSHPTTAALIGYLLGAVPFGLLLTRVAGLGDVRAIGSGTIGATNVLRTGRKGSAAATLFLDITKGYAAAAVGLYLSGVAGCTVAGIAVVLGHMFPVWLHFRGGKGIATGFGVLLAATPACRAGSRGDLAGDRRADAHLLGQLAGRCGGGTAAGLDRRRAVDCLDGAGSGDADLVAARLQHRAPSCWHRAADRRRAVSELTACTSPAPRV